MACTASDAAYGHVMLWCENPLIGPARVGCGLSVKIVNVQSMTTAENDIAACWFLGTAGVGLFKFMGHMA